MTTVQYVTHSGTDGEAVAALERVAPHLDVRLSGPEAIPERVSADCVVTTVETAVKHWSRENSPVGNADGVPVVLFDTGSHDELARTVDDVGATTYVRRHAAADSDGCAWVRLTETVEQLVATRGRPNTIKTTNTTLDAPPAEERDRLAALFDNTSDAIADIEFVDDRPVVRDVNPAFERRFGYDRIELLGENLDEFILPTEGESPSVDIAQMRAGDPFETEVRRRTATGVRDFLLRAVPLDSEKTDRVYAIYTDVTSRNRIERRLGRLHETTRTLVRAETIEEIGELAVRAANDVLGYPAAVLREFDAETRSLRLVAASATAEELLGSRPVDGPELATAWEAFESGTSRVFEDVAEQEPELAVRSVMYLPLGQRGLLTLGSVSSDAFDEAEQRLAQILAANVEVAIERADQTQLLREREDELARQNERLNEFASVASHDIRNPLSVARGYLDLVCDTLERGEDPTPHIERVERAHDRMNQLTEDLLTLARQGQTVGTTERVELSTVAAEAWDSVDTEEAILEVGESRTIHADAERLDTLFENLFRNSVEHGSTGSRVNAGDAVESGVRAVTVRVGALPDGFFVEDDGPGIDPDDRNRVFDRGYSTNESGTGFGLSIVSSIVEAHGWKIRATASDSGGARFEVVNVDAVVSKREDG